MRYGYVLRIVALLLLSRPAAADDRPPVAGPPSTGLIVVERCKLEYERDTTLGSYVLIQASGRIQAAHVRLGSRVKAGQVMGRLHDGDVLAELERLKFEVSDSAEVRLCEARLTQNQLNLARSRSLFQKGLYNKVQMEQEELEYRSVELELARARHSLRGDQLAMAKVEADLRSRDIVAPHDGIVVEVIKRLGESMLPHDPIYRMVDPGLLRVTGQVDVRDAWRVREGQSVRIRPDLAGVDLPIEREVFTGRVSFVDPRIDPETRTCNVVALVDNRDELLRSGIEARMEIVVEPAPPAEGPAPGLPPAGRGDSPDPAPPAGRS